MEGKDLGLDIIINYANENNTYYITEIPDGLQNRYLVTVTELGGKVVEVYYFTSPELFTFLKEKWGVGVVSQYFYYKTEGRGGYIGISNPEQEYTKDHDRLCRLRSENEELRKGDCY